MNRADRRELAKDLAEVLVSPDKIKAGRYIAGTMTPTDFGKFVKGLSLYKRCDLLTLVLWIFETTYGQVAVDREVRKVRQWAIEHAEAKQ